MLLLILTRSTAAPAQDHAERTAQISADLRRRGLLPPAGENLRALEIDEYLRSGGAAQRDRED